MMNMKREDRQRDTDHEIDDEQLAFFPNSSFAFVIADIALGQPT